MKQIFTATIFFALLFFSTQIFGQNTSPFWSLAGNNNATSNSKIGTTNNQILRIVTNNVTRLYLNTNGNIGVNTFAPRAPLHVNGLNKDSGVYSIARKYGVVGVDTTTRPVGESFRRPNAAGVMGIGGSYGVYGESHRIGVYGLGGIPTGGAAFGTGTGVLGVTEFGEGVKGVSEGTGVWGQGTFQGVYGVGQNYGVRAVGILGASDVGWGLYATGQYAVKADGYACGVHAVSSYPDTGKGVYGEGSYGVYGLGIPRTGGDEEGPGIGVYGKGKTGVYATTSTAINDAVRADAQGAFSSWGVYATSLNSYGIYASSLAPGVYAGYFAGDVFSTGNYVGSDEGLKKNIKAVNSGLDIINKLQPKYYEFRNDGDYAKMNLPQGSHYGLLAQEVEKVLPAMVKQTQFSIGKIKANELKGKDAASKKLSQAALEEKIDFKAVNYTELIPILIKATQELNDKVNELNRQNESLQEEIRLLKNNGAKNEISNAPLLQNVPNPVSGNTTIAYSLPENFSKASIVIANKAGSTIKQLAINGKGRGNINTDVSELTAGAYSYSLLVDGQVLATKQMVVMK